MDSEYIRGIYHAYQFNFTDYCKLKHAILRRKRDYLYQEDKFRSQFEFVSELMSLTEKLNDCQPKFVTS